MRYFTELSRGLCFLAVTAFSAIGTIGSAGTSFDNQAAANGRAPSVANAAPIAATGVDRTVVTGQIVTLDATESTDRDGDRLQFAWTLVTPPGSGARLSDPTAVRPTFTVDVLGDYFASVVVFDEDQRSAPASVRISTGNVAPVAKPGVDRRVAVGQGVALDAGASHDANHDALLFRWSVVEAPPTSRASVAATRASDTYFTPDREGDYVLSLTVSDGRLDSAPAFVRLSTEVVAPRADAGVDRKVVAGAALRLEGGAGLDSNATAASYAWSVIHAPLNASAELSDATSVTPQLRTSIAGLYVVQLTVDDGFNVSVPDTVVIEALPRAGVVQSIAQGAADTDGDGVPDTLDNCVEHFNPTQLDTNGDGFGNRCDADLDNDGFITNIGDLGLLRLAFFSTPGDANWDPDADFNGDLSVNIIDLGIMRTFFFGPPGPIAITFINPAGGSWHDPANWSPAIVPNTTHSVRIDLDPGVVVEYSTGTSEIAGLRTSSPLLISGGILSIAGDALFNDTVTLESGATLANANILPPTADPAPGIEIPSGQTVTFDGVTLGADLTVGTSSAQLTVLNDLMMNGATINIDSLSNGFSTLSFTGAAAATSTLGGTGEVVFSGDSSVESRARLIVSGSTHGLIIGSGITIRSGPTMGGAISHSSNNGPITVQGTIVSDVTGDTVSISAAPLTLSGAVNVSNDATFLATFQGVGGSIDSSATLDVNTGEIAFVGDFVQDGTITVTDSVLDLGNVVGDEWSNTGTITLSNATLELGGTFTLADVGTITGTGTTVINGTFDNTGQTVDLFAALPGTVEFANTAVVLGGTLNGGALTIPAGQTVTFDGVTLGADLTVGTSSAQLTVLNDLMMNGATINIDSLSNGFSTLSFTGAAAATSTLGGTGEVVFSGDSSVESRARLIVSGSTHGLIIGSGITIRSGPTMGGAISHSSNNGPITVQGTIVSDVTGDTVSISAAPLTLSGAVNVSNDATFLATFQGVGGSIDSSATLDVNTGEIALVGDFVQDGTITVTDSVLDLGNVVGDEWSNTGTITLSNATLELGGTFTLADVGTITGTGTTVINGTFDNTGQTVDLFAALPGTVEFANTAVVLGGTLNGGALTIPAGQTVTFDGVTLGADLTVGTSSAQLTVLNDLMMNGATINIDSLSNGFSTLSFTGAAAATSTLGGTGEVVFSGDSSVESRARLIVSGSTHGLIIGSGITIRSGPTMGGAISHSSNNGPITVQGTIVSDVTGDTVSISAAPLTLSGAVNVSNDATFLATFQGVGGSIDSSATLDVNTGEIAFVGDFVQDGTITVTDSVLDLGNVVGDEWSNTGTITLSNATLELGGTFTLADVGTITGTGTTVINGTFDNTGQTVDLFAALPGTVEFANTAVVLGGTLNGGALTIPAGQTVTFDGVTLGADLTVGTSSAQLTVLNDLMMNGATINIDSLSNGFSTLSFTGAAAATSTLGGTGEVVFSGDSSVESRARLIVSGSTHGLIIGSGITIRSGPTMGGAISHSSNNGPITVQGTIVSDVTGDTVSISAAPLTLSGAVNVSNDATFLATFQGVGGSIDSSATLDVNTGEIALVGDFVQDGTITVTDSVLDLGNVVGDEWSNTGTITLSNATLELGGTFTLADVGTITGTGTTVINGTFDNTGQTVDLFAALPGTVEFANTAVVLGGTLNGGALTIPAGQTVTFDGVTLGADLTVGTSSAQLTVLNDLMMNGATINIDSLSNGFSTLSFTGAAAATSTLGGTGEVVFSGDSSVESRARLIVSGSTHGLIIGSGITIRSGPTMGGAISHSSNNGPITVQGTIVSDVTGDTVSISAAPLTLSGAVNVSNDATFLATFQGVGGSIDSSATLDVNTGEIALVGDFVQDGTITVTDSVLDLGNVVGDEWSNTGTITLSNATLELGGTFTLADVGTITGTGTTVINGTFDNTGQTVDLFAALPGTVEFANTAVVLGGTLNGGALTIPAGQTVTFDGVTLGADLTVGTSSAQLTVLNDLMMNGATINIDSLSNGFSTLSFTGAAAATSTLGGTGEVVFSGDSSVESRARLIVSGSTHGLIIGSGITIRSGPTMGGAISHSSNNGPITVQGTIVSDVTGDTVSISGFPLSIEGDLDVGAGAIINAGNYTLEATATVNVDVGGLATTEFGRLTGTSATLDGTLNLSLVNAFSPSLADTFEIMTFSSRTGTFATENGTALGGGLSFQVNYNAADVTLEVIN